MQIILQWLPGFLLVFCRMSAFFIVAPVLSYRNVPAQFKVGLVIFISFITFVGLDIQEQILWNSEYVISLIRETLVGLILGFTAYIFFTIVQVMGSFVDLQMGFGIANLVDPMTGAQSPVMGNLNFFIAILLFLSINGHHYFLMAVMDSYQWVPFSNELFANILNGNVSTFIFESFRTMFVLAFQMAAPLIATLFLVDVSMGILARTAPQFNLFIIGIPIKIMVGFVVILIMIPSYLFLFQDIFATMFRSMLEALGIIHQE